MSRGFVLPAGCLLPLEQRLVVYAMCQDDDIPCLGCARREECPVRLDHAIQMAETLAGQPLAVASARDCPRCGGQIHEWSIKDNRRLWRCQNTVTARVFTDRRMEDGGQTGQTEQVKAPCGYTLCEIALEIPA